MASSSSWLYELISSDKNSEEEEGFKNDFISSSNEIFCASFSWMKHLINSLSIVFATD